MFCAFPLEGTFTRQGLQSIPSTEEVVRPKHALIEHSNYHGDGRQSIGQHRPTPGCSGGDCVCVSPATHWILYPTGIISIDPWLVQAVLAPSQVMPENAATVQGWDFDHGCTLDGLLHSFLQTGFQATAFGRAVAEVNRMVSLRSIASAYNPLTPARNGFSFLQLDRPQSQAGGQSQGLRSFCCSWSGA